MKPNMTLQLLAVTRYLFMGSLMAALQAGQSNPSFRPKETSQVKFQGPWEYAIQLNEFSGFVVVVNSGNGDPYLGKWILPVD